MGMKEAVNRVMEHRKTCLSKSTCLVCKKDVSCMYQCDLCGVHEKLLDIRLYLCVCGVSMKKVCTSCDISLYYELLPDSNTQRNALVHIYRDVCCPLTKAIRN